VFVSAALLFSMQPMFGKMILPEFGGAPAVWITSLVFFQLMLLVGYLYVHVTSAWLGQTKQAIVHSVLLLIVPVVAIPIRVHAGWGLTSPMRPITSVFLVLLASVGLSFFVVSTTAPLLQRWFGGTTHRLANDPFFLYAASNVGSIGALLIYPIVVEPRLDLQTQATVWAAGYGLLVVLTLACALAAYRAPSASNAGHETVGAGFPIPLRTRLRWIALAAVPSSLMLSVTSHITTDIAPVPLLWVIPLTIYLGTYVVAFSPRMAIVGRIAWYLLPFFVFIPLATLLSGMSEPPGYILFHLAAFELAAMVCHGQLADTRPGVSRLTEFYVWLAIGGAVGGLFNVIVAPFVFNSLAEYPIALVLACLLRGARPGTSSSLSVADAALVAGLGLVALVSQFVTGVFLAPRTTLGFAVYAFVVPALLALMFYRQALRFGLAVTVIIVVAGLYPDPSRSVIGAERSFFGVHRIVNRGSFRMLMNGSTNHGAQSLRPPRRCIPLTYYYPTGPLGDVFASFTGAHSKTNVGIVGLGTGSTGGYAKPGQSWTFYEIDPQIERIARDSRYFTYLRDCVPQARVKLGDARVSLATQPDSVHDVMVIDAFSSDAIPLHLLTREALSLYMRKLKPGGVIAFHISNRYVNLRRLLGRLARDAGLVAYIKEDQSLTALELYEGKLPSVWVIMARSGDDLGPMTAKGWLQMPKGVTGRAWTDSYSNVFETLKLHF
jgi:hypothetical protein